MKDLPKVDLAIIAIAAQYVLGYGKDLDSRRKEYKSVHNLLGRIW